MRKNKAYLNAQRFKAFISDFEKFSPEDREKCIIRIQDKCLEELLLFLKCLKKLNKDL